MKNTTIDKMSLSPIELADEISMSSKKYLLVEGQSDKLFWEHLQSNIFEKKIVLVANKKECSGNKEYVIKVISLVNKRRKNVIGIIDLDYDYVRKKVIVEDNLFYYKYIDLENVLIQAHVFTEVNKMISSSSKKLSDEELRNYLYDKVYILGLLRLLNDIEQYNFCFDDLEYKKLLKGDSESFLNYFMAKMQLKKAIQSEVVEKITSLQKEEHDKRYLCNGHDLLNVLSLATNRTISNDNPIKYTQDILEKMLILGHQTLSEKFDIKECADIIWDAK